MPHASVMTLRTTTSAAQNAPVFDAKSDSIARRAPSRPTPSLPPCAALRATLSSTLSRNPCSNERGERVQESPSTNGGTSSRCDLRSHKQPPDESGDRAQSKSSAFRPFSAQMTITHPIPAPGLRLPKASLQAQASRSPFFNPRRDGVA